MTIQIDHVNAEAWDAPTTADPSAVLDTRETMRVLPQFVQPFLTGLTGKPLLEEESWGLTPMHHLWASVLPVVIGLAVSTLAVNLMGWWLLLLPASWLLTVHGARKLRTMIFHQCSHANFLRDKSIDTFIGETISILFLNQNYVEYKREHIEDHHSSSHMTLKDPTVQFLLMAVGAKAGMSREQLWRQLIKTLISPRFHIQATSSRLASHFRKTSLVHKVVIVLYLSGQLGFVAFTGVWLVFLVAWVFPLTVLFNAAACLRLSSRHVFPAPGPRVNSRATLASFTHGIFLGEPVPATRLPFLWKVIAWFVWTARMLFVHLPARLFVLVGDGPAHDYHHRYPRSKDWANYIFARQHDLMAEHPGWPPYTEVWGLYAAIDAVFASLSQADPMEYSREQLVALAASAGELLAAFEE